MDSAAGATVAGEVKLIRSDVVIHKEVLGVRFAHVPDDGVWGKSSS